MRRIHLARHHAGDGERLAVEINCASNNLGVPVKGAVPKAIADDDECRRARFVFIFAERATDLRRQPDHVEKFAVTKATAIRSGSRPGMPLRLRDSRRVSPRC